jgi:hypothetical protein
VLAGGPEAPPLCVLQIVVLVGLSAGVRRFGRGCGGGSVRVVLVACPLCPFFLIGRRPFSAPEPLVLCSGSPRRCFGLRYVLGPLLKFVSGKCGIW